MAIEAIRKRKNEKAHYKGMSSDIKPPNAGVGDEFYEKDTNALFDFTNNRVWVQRTGGAGGASGGIVYTEVTGSHLTNVQDITDYLAGIADYEMIADRIHKFKILKEGYSYIYIYTGTLPVQSQSTVIGDYIVESVDLPFIEGSQVQKDLGNTDSTTLEVNDTVYFKLINDGGSPKTLVGYTYNGGDKTLLASYTQGQSITT